MSEANKKIWYRIEVLYNYRGEMKRFEYINCDGVTLHKMRQTIIDEGLQLPVSSDQWIIIFPWAVDCLTVWRQDKFYTHMESNLSTTVFKKKEVDVNGIVSVPVQPLTKSDKGDEK